MTDDNDVPSGAGFDEARIVVNSLHLCLSFLLDHIKKTNGKDAALEARSALIENVKNGNIDMAIFEDRKIFDFVISIVDTLPMPE